MDRPVRGRRTLREKLSRFLPSGSGSRKRHETGFQRFPSQPYVLFESDTEFGEHAFNILARLRGNRFTAKPPDSLFGEARHAVNFIERGVKIL